MQLIFKVRNSIRFVGSLNFNQNFYLTGEICHNKEITLLDLEVYPRANDMKKKLFCCYSGYIRSQCPNSGRLYHDRGHSHWSKTIVHEGSIGKCSDCTNYFVQRPKATQYHGSELIASAERSPCGVS